MCALQVTNIWNGSQMVSAFRVRSFPFNLDYGLWPLNIVNDDKDTATFSPAESGMGEILSIAVLNSRVKFNRTTNAKLFALNTLKFSVWTSRGAGLVLAYTGGLILLPMLRNVIRVIRPKLAWLFPADENIWL